ncbi:receptor-like protein EIX2 [Telopea speciosissima]|uniref:receptor-like protein EIX2 n=1 Tax=Telopea speciosissima TaxID=54955 RepID=UPI001CC594D1|nr:receptor-like protein EIX2 [Telopea speciosissima]
MKRFEVLLLIFLYIQITNFSVSRANKEVLCSKTEREALLSFKKGLQDPTNWLSSWIGEDCCTWKGVSCNNRTGRVVKLNLRQPYDAAIEQEFWDSPEQFDSYMNSLLGGEISPSLLELKHLKYLDLSVKNFNGISIPEFLGSLKSLRYLNLSNAGFGGMVPQQLGNLSSLRFLDLSTDSMFSLYSFGTRLHADSLQWLSNLSFLQYLGMSQVNLRHATDYLQVLNMIPSLTELFLSACELNPPPVLPAQLVNFTSLTVIDFSNNNFSSSVPEWLFSIKGLVSLNLRYTAFHGPIPGGLQNMTSLRVLDLSSNNFDSTIPDWLYNLSSLVTLEISSSNLRGSIMSAVGNLTSLTKIDLWGNELEGEIPTTVENLCKLQELFLSSNHFSGHLPDQLGQLKSLTSLYLQYNSFSGPIPQSVGRLSSLRILDLTGNRLNGSMPESFGHLSQLEELLISHNSLEGEASEVHFANLTRLKSFYASSNSLVLRVSSTWIPPFQLKHLHMGSWHVGPQFPAWLQTQRNMSSLELSYTGIFDEFPTWFWNLSSQISYLNLSNNQIHGELPRRLKLDSVYSMIFLGSNSLEGPLPHFSSNVWELDLSNNSFSGPISHFLCQEMDGQSKLEILDLSDNLLSGDIPDCWMNWQSLQVIKLGNNNFTRKVPSSLGSLLALQSLHLRNNHLSGKLPSSLQNCSDLQVIDLGKNEFFGSIPTWLGKNLPQLIVLVLHSNNFGGSIPPELCDLSSLQILDLAHNNLSGTIPQCFNNFSAMAA